MTVGANPSRPDDGARRLLDRSSSSVFAPLLAVAILSILYFSIDWSNTGDWRGYFYIFYSQGAYLAERGRDPLFVSLVNWSAQVFGGGGYELWRHIIFMIFMAAVLTIGLRLPDQKDRQATLIVVTLVLVTAFIIKSLVQIRECMAVMFVIFAFAPIFRGKHNPLYTLILLFISVSLHRGTAGLALAYILSLVLAVGPQTLLRELKIQQTMLLGSAVLGVAIALTIAQFSNQIITAMTVIGADTTTRFQSNLLKSAYWIVLGGVMLAIRAHTLAALDPQKREYLLGVMIAGALLPALYFVALTLNLAGFQAPVVTGLFVRGMASTMELCLIIVLWRGRGNMTTAGLAAILLVDRLRNLFNFLEVGG